MMSSSNPGQGLTSGLGSNFGGDLASIFGGLFGNSGGPYSDAMKQFQRYYNQARNSQNPFYNAGVNAIGGYQDWLSKMKDPGAFLNNLQGQYQQSGYNKFLQDQAQRAGINAASVGGLANGMGGAGIGSSPFAQQMQQNSANIAQGGLNDWLGQAIGLNTQYGGGLNNLMQGGQHAADIMSDLAMRMGGQMGQGAFGQRFGRNQDFWNLLSGGLGLFGF